jgi:hypothetical protein
MGGRVDFLTEVAALPVRSVDSRRVKKASISSIPRREVPIGSGGRGN